MGLEKLAAVTLWLRAVYTCINANTSPTQYHCITMPPMNYVFPHGHCDPCQYGGMARLSWLVTKARDPLEQEHLTHVKRITCRYGEAVNRFQSMLSVISPFKNGKIKFPIKSVYLHTSVLADCIKSKNQSMTSSLKWMSNCNAPYIIVRTQYRTDQSNTGMHACTPGTHLLCVFWYNTTYLHIHTSLSCYLHNLSLQSLPR